MHVCIYIYIYIYVCMYIHIYVAIYVMYSYMYIRRTVFIHSNTDVMYMYVRICDWACLKPVLSTRKI